MEFIVVLIIYCALIRSILTLIKGCGSFAAQNRSSALNRQAHHTHMSANNAAPSTNWFGTNFDGVDHLNSFTDQCGEDLLNFTTQCGEDLNRFSTDSSLHAAGMDTPTFGCGMDFGGGMNCGGSPFGF